MLNSHTPLATALPVIVLDLLQDNWTAFLQAFKLQCTTKFGAAGQQIITDKIIPLTPFALPPTKFDLEKNAAGIPLPNQFVYPRRQLTAAEVATENFNPSPLPLSDRGSTELRADLKIYHDAANKFSDFDTALLDYIYSHISLASHTSIRAHANFAAYQLLPIGARSFEYYKMVRDNHSTGNASTKLHRTRQFLTATQDNMSHESYMEQITNQADTFRLDFESAEHPGYVSISEFTSAIYLQGLSTHFRRPLDDLLHATPSGRFPNTSLLMTELQNWKIAHALSIPHDAISTQGSALIANTPPQHPKQTPTSDKSNKKTTSGSPKTPHLHPLPCSWCLAADKVQRFGHLASNCSKNPNRTNTPSLNNNKAPSTTSHLRALLSQLESAESPNDTNNAMMLIAEAAIAAADFPDTLL